MLSIVRIIVLLACAYAGSALAGLQFADSTASPDRYAVEVN